MKRQTLREANSLPYINYKEEKFMERQTMYESARKFSHRKIISERQLREMIASGKVPGIKTARGFKINVGMFLEKLDTMSQSAQQVDL